MSVETEVGAGTLAVRGLSASYGPVTALDGVDVTAEPGRITAVLGANGAGKTTLLRTVSGLVRPTAGRVMLGGRELTRAAAEEIARAGVAHVPEGRGVITELTVEENLRLGGWGDADDRRPLAATARHSGAHDLYACRVEAVPRLVEQQDRRRVQEPHGHAHTRALPH